MSLTAKEAIQLEISRHEASISRLRQALNLIVAPEEAETPQRPAPKATTRKKPKAKVKTADNTIQRVQRLFSTTMKAFQVKRAILSVLADNSTLTRDQILGRIEASPAPITPDGMAIYNALTSLRTHGLAEITESKEGFTQQGRKVHRFRITPTGRTAFLTASFHTPKQSLSSTAAAGE